MADNFALLLDEISKILNVELKPDSKNLCVLKMESGLKIQMEIDPNGRQFILSSTIGEVPPGRYRENLFREALIQNGSSDAQIFLGFSQRTNRLIAFKIFEMYLLTGEKIVSLFPSLLEKAQMWTEALTRGEIPAKSSFQSGKTSGMFGLG